MKKLIIAMTCLLSLATAQAEEGFHRYEYPGYDDTPLISGYQYQVHQPDRPQPPRVIPNESSDKVGLLPPSDAIVLFDGSDLRSFKETTWQVEDGRIIAGKQDLSTKVTFGDCQLHIEWRAPNPPNGNEPNNMGNSGIFFMGRYELQIFDSYACKIYADGSAASIYGQTPPAVNACKRPGEWQSYDVIFTAPVFRDEKLVEEARITVLHNGALVHNHTKILGPTRHKSTLPYKSHAPRQSIDIQGHSSPVEFQNIWVREL